MTASGYLHDRWIISWGSGEGPRILEKEVFCKMAKFSSGKLEFTLSLKTDQKLS